jgi:type IV pilus assembly protein PilC
MGQFQYKAKDGSGKVKKGTLTASNKQQARKQLMRMRLKPIMLKVEKASTSDMGEEDGITWIVKPYLYKDEKGVQITLLGEEKPSAKDLIVFTKQFATMLNSGVPLIQSLGILADQQRILSFGRKLKRVRAEVENGAALSEALEAYPDIFDTLYVSMVRAGEASGNLDTILMKLVTYIEKADKIKGQVKSAMMYPVIVVVVAIVVVSALLIFVVPTFASQYEGSGKALPALTQIVIDMSDILTEYWMHIFGGLFAALQLFKHYINTDNGRIWWDDKLLKFPAIGNLLKKIAVGRFCSTMSTMMTSGVNLLDALTICAASSGNKTIEIFVLGVRASVEQGEKMSEPLGEGTLFPPMVVSMVSVGEATGALDDMLNKVSEFYEDEVDLAVKGLLSLIEPVMIVGIGGFVGFIMIAMYLPVFDLGDVVGG